MYPAETDVSHPPGYFNGTPQTYRSGPSNQSASTMQPTMLPSNTLTNSTISQVPPTLGAGHSVAGNNFSSSAPFVPMVMSNTHHLVHRSNTAPQCGTPRTLFTVGYQRSQSDRPRPESREMSNVPHGGQQTAQRSGQYQNSGKGAGQPNDPDVFRYQTDKSVQPQMYRSSTSSWVSSKVKGRMCRTYSCSNALLIIKFLYLAQIHIKKSAS